MSMTEYSPGIRLPHHIQASGTTIASAAAIATSCRQRRLGGGEDLPIGLLGLFLGHAETGVLGVVASAVRANRAAYIGRAEAG